MKHLSAVLVTVVALALALAGPALAAQDEPVAPPAPACMAPAGGVTPAPQPAVDLGGLLLAPDWKAAAPCEGSDGSCSSEAECDELCSQLYCTWGTCNLSRGCCFCA